MDTLEQDLLVRLKALHRQIKQTEPGTPEHEALAEDIRTTRNSYEDVRERVRDGLHAPKEQKVRRRI